MVLLFVDLKTIGKVLRDVRYTYMIPALMVYFIAVYARTLRWRFLLRPMIGTPVRAIYPVVVVGYMANNLIPIRIGEILRSYYLSMRESISPISAFGTITVERAFDVMVLLSFFTCAALVLPISGVLTHVAGKVPGGIPLILVVAVLPFVVVTGVLALAGFAPNSLRTSVIRVLTRLLPVSIRDRIVKTFVELVEGLTVIRSPAGLLKLALLSLPVWLLEATMCYLILLGFDFGSNFDNLWEILAVVLVFTAAANLAGVFPSSAGSWGPFDFFGAAALVALGVESGVAAAYAITVHVALWLPVTSLGVLLLIMDRTSLRHLLSVMNSDASNRKRSQAASSAKDFR